MQRGMTLIEILVYIALVSVIVTVLSSAYVSFVRANARVEAVAITNNNLRFVADSITRDVASADVVLFPEGAASSTLSLARSTSTVQYMVDGFGVLIRIEDGVSEKLTSGDVRVTDIRFERTMNVQPLLPATSTGVTWSVHMNYAAVASEYQYDAVRRGTVRPMSVNIP